LDFNTVVTKEQWRKIIAVAKMRGLSKPGFVVFMALPESISDQAEYVSLKGEHDGNKLNWCMRRDTVPDTLPPKSVKELSKKVGSIPGFWHTCEELLIFNQTEIEFSVLSAFDMKEWRANIKLLSLAEIGIPIEGGSLVGMDIVLPDSLGKLHLKYFTPAMDGNHFIIVASGKVSSSINSSIFDGVAKVALDVIHKIMIKSIVV
jgi:hypothetical protein